MQSTESDSGRASRRHVLCLKSADSAGGYARDWEPRSGIVLVVLTTCVFRAPTQGHISVDETLAAVIYTLMDDVGSTCPNRSFICSPIGTTVVPYAAEPTDRQNDEEFHNGPWRARGRLPPADLGPGSRCKQLLSA